MSDPSELIDKLFERPDRDEWSDVDAAGVLDKAVRAVLDLHNPREAIGGGDEERITVCDHSGDLWPCPTVQAITTALGGSE